MRPGRAILLYLTVVFLGGALMAPGLWAVATWAGAHFPGLRFLADNPFHRFVNRAVLGTALLGLWPFLRATGVRRWADLGLPPPAGHGKELALGLGLGLGSLAGLALVILAAGGRQMDGGHSLAQLTGPLINAALSAVVVGCLEEVLFRGALFGLLCRAHHWVWALLVSSAIYALVHFFERPDSPTVINWMSGMVVLCRMMRGFVEFEHLVPGFFNLALAGVLLGVAFRRTGTIYSSIGLHAGWIFWLKSYNILTATRAGASVWIWGSGRLIDGWAAMAILGLTLWVLCKIPVRSAGVPVRP
jgi:uncharacterized protein